MNAEANHDSGNFKIMKEKFNGDDNKTVGDDDDKSLIKEKVVVAEISVQEGG